MSILIGFLTVLEVLVCLLLILLILMQRPRQEGLGATFASDTMSNLAGAQATNVLQKGTTWLTAVLFITTILLGVLTAHHQGADTNLKLVDAPAVKPVAPVTAEVKPAAPQAKPAISVTPASPTAPASTKPAITVTPATTAPAKDQSAAAPTKSAVTPTPTPAAPPAPTPAAPGAK
jgi:preprotein translocase subunit SecG